MLLWLEDVDSADDAISVLDDISVSTLLLALDDCNGSEAEELIDGDVL